MGSIVGLLFLVFLGYSNSVKAKQKGKNGILWGGLTIVSYIIFEAIGTLIVITAFCRGEVDMTMFDKAGTANFNALSTQFNTQVETALTANPMRGLLASLIGFGGFLFIRFLIDRNGDKKAAEVHWMDKLEDKSADNDKV